MRLAFAPLPISAENPSWLNDTDVLLHLGRTLETPSRNLVREQWLQANGVHTEFLDAGIGSCWFAGQGEADPDMVCSETEEGAIALLARNRGLTLWDEAAP